MKINTKIILPCCLLAIGLHLTACTSPCDVPKAKNGFEQARPIVAALKKYHEQKRIYPQSLSELVPEYLDKLPEEINGVPLKYNRNGEKYNLLVHNETPSLPDSLSSFFGNQCYYSPPDS